MNDLYLLMSEQYITNAFDSRNPHTYFVGIFDNKDDAISKAQQHSQYRGGKYTCYVYKVRSNDYYDMGLTSDKLIYSYNAKTDLIF